MRYLPIVLAAMILTTVSFATSMPASAALVKVYSSSERAAIRSMPIERRPNRPGHFYGNTVRRLNSVGR